MPTKPRRRSLSAILFVIFSYALIAVPLLHLALDHAHGASHAHTPGQTHRDHGAEHFALMLVGAAMVGLERRQRRAAI